MFSAQLITSNMVGTMWRTTSLNLLIFSNKLPIIYFHLHFLKIELSVCINALTCKAFCPSPHTVTKVEHLVSQTQQLATVSYPEPNECSPRPHNLALKISLILNLPQSLTVWFLDKDSICIIKLSNACYMSCSSHPS